MRLIELVKASSFYKKHVRDKIWRLVDFYRVARLLPQLPRDIGVERYLRSVEAEDRLTLAERRKKHSGEYSEFDEPLVSVVIPTYSRGELLLKRTLPTILNQTYKNLEIIVIGDCCSDNTPELMKQVKDSRVYFENLKERGRYPKAGVGFYYCQGWFASVTGMDLAKGKWIARLDDDDQILPDHIEFLLDLAYKGDYEFVSAGMREEIAPGKWQVHRGSTLPIGSMPFRAAGVPHAGVLFRQYLRSYRPDFECWRLRIPGDNLWWRRLGRAGVRSGCSDRVVCVQELRPGESSSTITAIRAKQNWLERRMG